MNGDKKTLSSWSWGTKVGALLMACMFVVNSTAVAAGKGKKVADDINQTSGRLVNVIVQYADGPSATHATKAKHHGATVKQNLPLVKGATMSLPANRIPGLLLDDSAITYVSPDRVVKNSGNTDAFVAVNTDVAQSYGYTGSGIGVAVIDSGISTAQPDLARRVVYNQDFTGQGTADDLYGHGTHVAGIIAGNGGKSSCSACFLTYEGVAQSVRLINLRVLDNNGSGSDSEVINAIQTAINLKSQYNIRVINLSLGRGIYESYKTDPLTQAVEQAWKAGIFVVVAAGNYGRDNSNDNNGYATITSPGNDPYVITVGAMRTMGTQTRVDDAIASYSSKGPSMLDHVV
ncbi:MAG TPA: S8 family serine peptidase, partial [Terriglobales bacterium]|nr:S8 family serine peptidase [Terriglobales bacterium]